MDSYCSQKRAAQSCQRKSIPPSTLLRQGLYLQTPPWPCGASTEGWGSAAPQAQQCCQAPTRSCTGTICGTGVTATTQDRKGNILHRLPGPAAPAELPWLQLGPTSPKGGIFHLEWQWNSCCLPWHHQALTTWCIPKLGRRSFTSFPRKYEASSTPTAPSAAVQCSWEQNSDTGRRQNQPQTKGKKKTYFQNLLPYYFFTI